MPKQWKSFQFAASRVIECFRGRSDRPRFCLTYSFLPKCRTEFFEQVLQGRGCEEGNAHHIRDVRDVYDAINNRNSRRLSQRNSLVQFEGGVLI
jgi:hypothetical protein